MSLSMLPGGAVTNARIVVSRQSGDAVSTQPGRALNTKAGMALSSELGHALITPPGNFQHCSSTCL